MFYVFSSQRKQIQPLQGTCSDRLNAIKLVVGLSLPLTALMRCSKLKRDGACAVMQPKASSICKFLPRRLNSIFKIIKICGFRGKWVPIGTKTSLGQGSPGQTSLVIQKTCRGGNNAVWFRCWMQVSHQAEPTKMAIILLIIILLFSFSASQSPLNPWDKMIQSSSVSRQ